MSISFEFENMISPESPIYPLIANLSGTVTLYPTEELNRYESEDFPIFIVLNIEPECYHMYIVLISCSHQLLNIDNDISYNDSAMKCLTKIEGLYSNININSPNRYHPLYQLLENQAIRDNDDSALWEDYTLVTSFASYNRLVMITLNDRVIHKSIRKCNYHRDNLAKELVEKIDAGLMDELLVRPLTSKSARN